MEKILDLRTNTEKNAMAKFATVQNELQQQKFLLTSLENELESFNKVDHKNLDISRLKFNNLYKQNLENQISIQEARVEEISHELENMRLELVSAQKDRKIMEKFKEKDFTIYKNDIKAMEQKELDEIAIQRHKPQ